MSHVLSPRSACRRSFDAKSILHQEFAYVKLPNTEFRLVTSDLLTHKTHQNTQDCVGSSVARIGFDPAISVFEHLSTVMIRAWLSRRSADSGLGPHGQGVTWGENLCTNSIFRCIIPVVFYLQLNMGVFESKHNYLMLLSLFKLTTCFGPCTRPSSGHKIYD